MIQITKSNGQVTTRAICDSCREGLEWDQNLSISSVERILRMRKWKAGKHHTCDKCLAKKEGQYNG